MSISSCIPRLAVVLLFISSTISLAQPIPVSSVATDQLAVGSTLYQIDGVVSPRIIDGVLVGDQETGPTKKSPFGFVQVFRPAEDARVVVRAEAKDRSRLLVSRFGDGWRINHIGPVWVDIDVYQHFTVDGTELEFVTQRGELQFTIEGQKPDDSDQDDGNDPDPETASPFTEQGLQVLIVYDTDKVLPASQTEVLFGGTMMDYLDSHCLKVEGNPSYRVLDKDTTGPADNRFIKALALPRESIPWLIVGNGVKGFQGPLPQTVDATIAILEGFQ